MIETQQQDGQIKPLLDVQGLGVTFGGNAAVRACTDIAFSLHAGEILGIVGESGSGKSVTCRALTGLLPETASVVGQMQFDGENISLADVGTLERLRGTGLSMIFQDPMSALDPLMSVRRHLQLRSSADPLQMMRQAGLEHPEPLLGAFAHQISGGQCQRVAIACALARNPKVLIADEPTTALDVTVQAGILRQLRHLAEERGMAIIFVTHDLAVVHEICERVLVMHDGRIVEHGPVEQVLTAPQDAYTRSLLQAIPRPALRGQRLGITVKEGMQKQAVALPQPINTANTTPILQFDAITVQFQRADGSLFDAVKEVSLAIRPGEIVGLVGESGSGKSTIAKTAVGLAEPHGGKVMLNGETLDWHRPQMKWRRQVQYIFQDPRGALDPAARILAQVRAPLDIHRIGDKAQRIARAVELLSETGCDSSLHQRKPGNLSGGQRQRVTVARALTLRPEVLICDESVSALDVSVQARVLNLLMDLREKFGIAILFISHDLSVIHHLCDRVVVMRQGELVEQGDTESIFERPVHAYTKTLLGAIPQLPENTAWDHQQNGEGL